ncbi:unnamed protein product [Acanthoscelides obtectus]|uniref:MADF domain-containing protein n=1 Tax=Acanthoscelides obtectus TaxID=200917 RepID=A0A9P0LXS4_ACAOB|nr:unnamed protein product [Acanthoscelides obtectus]CAK1654758.1 hypothetical protein AOBTE_LOCUS18821 [Acanthoscelides obtectus]
MNDELLIQLVEKCPHIYNKTLKEYKDDKMKDNSWLSIAEFLDSEPAIVKKRWDNLRDRFVRAYRQYNTVLPSGSGGGTQQQPDFPYFEIMMWLIPFIRKRKLISSTAPESTSKVPYIEEVESEPLLDDYVVGSDGVLSPEPTQSRPTSSHSSRPDSACGHKKSIQESMATALQNFSKICEKRFGENTENSDTHFMKSILDDMQHLPLKKKIKFKKEVMELLVKYIENEDI